MLAPRSLLLVARLLTLAGLRPTPASAEPPLEIGSRLELFVDGTLIERLTGGARQQLQRPTPQILILTTDQPWEGNAVNYVTAFQDDGVYRLDYRGADVQYDANGYRETHREVTCYAESQDGIRWKRPHLGLVEFQGSTANNIVRDGVGTHCVMPTCSRCNSATDKRNERYGG